MMGVFLRTGSTELSKILLGKNPEGEGATPGNSSWGCAAQFFQS